MRPRSRRQHHQPGFDQGGEMFRQAGQGLRRAFEDQAPLDFTAQMFGRPQRDGGAPSPGAGHPARTAKRPEPGDWSSKVPFDIRQHAPGAVRRQVKLDAVFTRQHQFARRPGRRQGFR